MNWVWIAVSLALLATTIFLYASLRAVGEAIQKRWGTKDGPERVEREYMDCRVADAPRNDDFVQPLTREGVQAYYKRHKL